MTARRGFSLLEVLVALLIASVAAAALVRSAHSVVAGRARDDALERSATAAEISMERLLATDPATWSTGTTEDEPASEGAGLRRRIEVREGPRPNLLDVRVVVRDRLGGAEVSLRTLVRRPFEEVL